MKMLTAKELALYLGCEAYGSQKYDDPLLSESRTGILIDIDLKENSAWLYSNGVQQRFLPHNVKPILRSLSDITEDELGELIIVFSGEDSSYYIASKNTYGIEIDSKEDDGMCLNIHYAGGMDCVCKDNNEYYAYPGAQVFAYLLSKGFDLFGFIEQGLAIDATKREAQP